MENFLRNKSNATVFLVFTFFTAVAVVVFFMLLIDGEFDFTEKSIFYIVYSAMPGVLFVLLNFVLFKKKFFYYGFVWNFNVWWLFAWLLPIVLLGITIVFLSFDMFFNIQADFSLQYYMQSLQKSLSAQDFLQYQKNFEAVGAKKVIYSMIAQALLLGSTSGAFLSLLEEAGWRGFLQREWANIGFLKSSLFVAVLQSLWSLPLVWFGVFFPAHKLLGSVMIVLSSVALGVLLSYIRYRSASIFPVVIARGFFFALFDMPMVLFSGGNDLSKHPLGVYGFFSILIIVILLLGLSRRVTFFSVPDIDVLDKEEEEFS